MAARKTTLRRTAEICVKALLDVGSHKRKWSPFEKRQWTRAYNALRRLSDGERV